MKAGFNDKLAVELYQDFCEAEGGVNHPVFEAWCKCEDVFGEIQSGDPVDNLFLQTIRYVIDALEVKTED